MAGLNEDLPTLTSEATCYAAIPIRHLASACWRRIASVRTNSPGIASALFSSTKPRIRSACTTSGWSYRKLPPPNNLSRARRSNLVSSSQTAASDIGENPLVPSVPEDRASKVNERLRRTSGGWTGPNKYLHRDREEATGVCGGGWSALGGNPEGWLRPLRALNTDRPNHPALPQEP
jgi:hypothetical protein